MLPILVLDLGLGLGLGLVYGWWGGWGGMGRGQANHEPSDPILKYKIRSIAFGDLGASNQGDSL